MRQLWTQAAVIALTAGTLSACATDAPQYAARAGQAPAPATTRPTPNFPISQAPAQPQAKAAPNEARQGNGQAHPDREDKARPQQQDNADRKNEQHG